MFPSSDSSSQPLIWCPHNFVVVHFKMRMQRLHRGERSPTVLIAALPLEQGWDLTRFLGSNLCEHHPYRGSPGGSKVRKPNFQLLKRTAQDVYKEDEERLTETVLGMTTLDGSKVDQFRTTAPHFGGISYECEIDAGYYSIPAQLQGLDVLVCFFARRRGSVEIRGVQSRFTSCPCVRRRTTIIVLFGAP